MKDVLIICPVGMDYNTDDRWKDHWRLTNTEREYETLVIAYNDYEPPIGTYDHIIHQKGHKWNLIKKIKEHFPYDAYKYIGCLDDDLVTDYQSINVGIKLAKRFDFGLWQLSMPPDSDLHPTYHNCLKQDLTCTFSETNFIEMGSPFFKIDLFEKLLDFLSHWEFKIGMGIDKVFCNIFECPANVVHYASIHQPFRTSYYDKSFAHNEMVQFLYHDFSKIMKEHYNRDITFNDMQVVFNKFRVTGKI
jgi:hypothetical protein